MLLLWIPFLLISCSVQNIQQLDVKFARNNLLPVVTHEITMTYHPATSLIMVQDNMQIDRERVRQFSNGAFILNKSAYLSSVRIEGTNDIVRQMTMVKPEYFNYELNAEQWKRVDLNGNVFEVELGNYREDQKTINVSVKYHIKADKALEGIQINEDSFLLNGNFFWMPSTFADQVPVTVHVVTPQRFHVVIPGYDGQESQVESLLKETTFVIPVAYEPITVTGQQ
jgi:hypothetical protein